jgi:hypothetical protein
MLEPRPDFSRDWHREETPRGGRRQKHEKWCHPQTTIQIVLDPDGGYLLQERKHVLLHGVQSFTKARLAVRDFMSVRARWGGEGRI